MDRVVEVWPERTTKACTGLLDPFSAVSAVTRGFAPHSLAPRHRPAIVLPGASRSTHVSYLRLRLEAGFLAIFHPSWPGLSSSPVGDARHFNGLGAASWPVSNPISHIDF